MSDSGSATSGVTRPTVPLDRKVPLSSKLLFASGAVAFGVKDLSFALLLTFYFNQVIGVPAITVGAALFLALILDAFIDPIVGTVSDNLRTPWGRRHPFLYASAIPVGLFFMLLWFPPDPASSNMFLFIFGIAFLVRATMSCFEVPMASLGPELTSDYHERTQLFALRFFFGWAGASTLLLFTFAVILPAYPGAQLNPLGYHDFAIVAAIIMTSAILIAALGTHREIKHLPVTERRKLSLAESFAELRQSFGNRAFMILMLCTLFANTSQGLSFGLLTYFITYFWEFESTALAWFIVAQVIGIGLAVFASTRLSRRIGKRRAAVRFMLLTVIITPIAYVLRVLGLFPENGDPILLPLLMTLLAMSSASLVSALILKISMLTDVIEDDAERTGIRHEGVFFAGQFFVQKCVSGLGIAVTATIIAIIAFPTGAEPGTIAQSTLNSLALIYAGLVIVLGLAAAAIVSRFPIEQADHESRIARMRGAITETT